jgi:protocatechuate 3,4-dioxygenase beta subunit
MPFQPPHDPHHGLAHDLQRLHRQAQRRETLRWLAASGVATATPLALFACGGGGSDGATTTASTSTGTTTTSGSTTSGTTSTTTTDAGTCAVIPEETGGPYPADGSNTNGSSLVNALTLSGIVRSDIRSSVAGASGTAAGVPLTVKLQLVNVASNCASLAGYAIYIWHCTRDGLYSLYSQGVTGENYLRGVQATDSSGAATFTTIFPGCYSGRMTHIHLEVYKSLSTATNSTNRLKTSQFTFPLDTLKTVYATGGYAASVSNLAQISYATDNVFSDGTSLQMATMSGDTTNGYAATLQIGIAA